MKNSASSSFEALPMPRRDIPQPATGSYRVYKNAVEYVTVDAGSALEALQKSGVESAYKIERDSIDYVRVLAPSAWGAPAERKMEAPAAAQAQQAVESAAAAAEEPKETVLIDADGSDAAAGAAEEKPLSDEEVNKLLNN